MVALLWYSCCGRIVPNCFGSVENRGRHRHPNLTWSVLAFYKHVFKEILCLWNVINRVLIHLLSYITNLVCRSLSPHTAFPWPIFLYFFADLPWYMCSRLYCSFINCPFYLLPLSLYILCKQLRQLLISVTLTMAGGWFSPPPPPPLFCITDGLSHWLL